MVKFLFTSFLIVMMFVPMARVSAAPTAAEVANGMVDVWVFVDADLNGIYSAGDNGLTDVSACLVRGDWVSCVGTDSGDTWWEDLEAGDYVSSIDPATLPAGYEIRSIRCEETSGRVEYSICQYDLPNRTATYSLESSTRINIFFALTPSTNLEEVPPAALLPGNFLFLPFLRGGSVLN